MAVILTTFRLIRLAWHRYIAVVHDSVSGRNGLFELDTAKDHVRRLGAHHRLRHNHQLLRADWNELSPVVRSRVWAMLLDDSLACDCGQCES